MSRSSNFKFYCPEHYALRKREREREIKLLELYGCILNDIRKSSILFILRIILKLKHN